MPEELNASVKEIRQIIRVLDQMRALAQEASESGELHDGQAYLIQQYKAIVAALIKRGVTFPDYFPSVPPDTMGAVVFACAQLATFLGEYLKDEFPQAYRAA
jgi:hypothetical protein